jgi:hypothetical protein
VEAGRGGHFADLLGQFSSDDGVVLSNFGFNGWEENLQPLSPLLLSLPVPVPLTPPSTATSASLNALGGASASTDNLEDSEDVDVDDHKLSDFTGEHEHEHHLTLALSSQLVALSQRATRAMDRLIRPGEAPLTVSSPEVSGALEDTNTLIRIINNITASDCGRGDSTGDSTTTHSLLPLLALTCHQHLVALFRAICEAIYRCQKEHYQQVQHHRSRQHSDIGPSSVAQFVMVLQLLMHLINRIDRSLFPSNPSMRHGARISSGQIIPITPGDSVQSQALAGSSSTHGGLLVLVQDVVRTIPNEHERLRQIIQKLQTEVELWLGNA